MRFVPIKTIEQQDVQALHRVRERLIIQRTGLINRNKTNGVYGICCHDLGDLVLHTIELSEKPDGTTYLVLGIDS